MQDRYIFPAFLCRDGCEGIGIVFPDLPGCTSQADSDADVMRMAKEGLSLHLWGMEIDGEAIPSPTPIKDLRPEADQTTALIEVFMPPFRAHMSERSASA